MDEAMPKTCIGCKDCNNKKFRISPCDRYSLGTHQECYDKMDADDLKAIKERLVVPCCDSPSKEKCEQCQEIGLANPLNH